MVCFKRLEYDRTVDIGKKYVQETTRLRFKPGSEFQKHFPDYSTVTTDGNIKSLTDFKMPLFITEKWQERFQKSLNDLQIKAINEYRILDGKSLLVVAPTSSGKTFIEEMAAAKVVIQRQKAVFLLPTEH
ncbi:MAG: hypothetical protein NG784_07975 [Candidatus Jettenia sp.]|nr:hypothetical protein [Candidatus Jettenia sp.]